MRHELKVITGKLGFAGLLHETVTREDYARSKPAPDAYLAAAPKFVDDMFSGPKATLRPIYDALLELAFNLGKDIRVSPAKTIVPIYRNHVIAQIKPSTRTRVDFGLALGDGKPTARLESTGGFDKGDRITHNIALSTIGDVDANLAKFTVGDRHGLYERFVTVVTDDGAAPMRLAVRHRVRSRRRRHRPGAGAALPSARIRARRCPVSLRPVPGWNA